jgi:hypothetical protein
LFLCNSLKIANTGLPRPQVGHAGAIAEFLVTELPPDVKEILGQWPEPVVLRPDKAKWLLLTLGMLFCIWLGAVGWSVVPENWFYLFLFGFIIVVGIFGVIGGVIAIATGAMWLRLDTSGFECRWWLWPKPKRWKWDAISEFSIVTTRQVSVVVFGDQTRPRWWELNRLSYGGRQYLPDTYGLGSENLAILMNVWRERVLQKIPKNKETGA